jgi:hypothetical protein
MIEENGMPKLGSSAVLLGVRRGKDIDVDQRGQVNRPGFRPRGRNGLSCAATIHSLPLFALPVEWGGSNNKTTVWELHMDDVPAELIAGDDSIPGRNRHVPLGRGMTMGYDEFVNFIEATRTVWRKVTKT